MHQPVPKKRDPFDQVDDQQFLEGINQALFFLLESDTTEQSIVSALRSIAQTTNSLGVFLFQYKEGGAPAGRLLSCGGLAWNKTTWETMYTPAHPFSLELAGTPAWLQELKGGAVTKTGWTVFPLPFSTLIDEKKATAVHFPVILENELWGFLSLVAETAQASWILNKSDWLKPLAKSLGSFLTQYEGKRLLLIEQQLNSHILATIPDCIYIIDIDSASFKYLNITNESRLLGFQFARSMNPMQFFRERVHPDDIGPNFDHLHEYLQTAADDQIIETEYRMAGADQQWVWVQQRSKVFSRYPDGRVKEYLALIQDVTEKVETETTLADSIKRLNLVIQGAHLGTWDWDIQTGEFAFNNQWAGMLGFNREEIVPNWEVFFNLIHPEDLARVWEAFQTHLEEKSEFFELEYRMRTKAGDWKWIYNRGRIFVWDQEDLPRRALGTHMDITEKKLAEMALRESEALQKAILYALPDIKFRINSQGNILAFYSSPEYMKDLYTPPAVFLGRKVTDILPCEVGQPMLEKIQIALSTAEVQNMEYALEYGEEKKYFEARLSAINAEEVILVSRNVTKAVMTQQELAKKVKELDEKNRQLTKYIDSNVELENFAYVASHDLLEPVRTMRNFAQILQKKYHKSLDQPGNEYLNFIIDGAENMHYLIQDLLTYSRANTEEHDVEDINLPVLIEQIKESLYNMITEKNAVISVENLPILLVGNKIKIQQVFQNLLANAIKFNRPGHRPEICIRTKEWADQWQFEIQDNGIGIKESYFQKIFLLFKKLHSRNEYQGTGIGLALCKKIVEQHGGRIWVKSTFGEGSTFFFTIRKGLDNIKRGMVNR